METQPTDWGQYYRNPAKFSGFTRKISEKKIVGLLREHHGVSPASMLELGGANSCFADGVLDAMDPETYHVADTNQFGIDLFTNKYGGDSRAKSSMADALNLPSTLSGFDIVYSVGLIEHFGVQGTAKCIESHFQACRANGIVLITFPTPTWLYLSVRKSAEWTGNWAFPDERPLGFDEVCRTCDKLGTQLHQSINWAIGLTQGYVVYRKNP